MAPIDAAGAFGSAHQAPMACGVLSTAPGPTAECCTKTGAASARAAPSWPPRVARGLALQGVARIASVRIANSWSISARLIVSGGEKASTLPVGRESSPRAKQVQNTS